MVGDESRALIEQIGGDPLAPVFIAPDHGDVDSTVTRSGELTGARLTGGLGRLAVLCFLWPLLRLGLLEREAEPIDGVDWEAVPTDRAYTVSFWLEGVAGLGLLVQVWFIVTGIVPLWLSGTTDVMLLARSLVILVAITAVVAAAGFLSAAIKRGYFVVTGDQNSTVS